VRRIALGLFALTLPLGFGCGDPASVEPSPTPCPPATSAYATSVVESWLPACSLAQNIYNDPRNALGRADAAGSGPRNYTGFVSLGFGGHVTLDLGGCVTDQLGNDIRVYQAVSGEPVSVYASTSLDGPFTLLQPLFQGCGDQWVPGHRQRGYCDFDFTPAGVTQARYVRVEDAELFPCPGDTPSEGADLDAVQALAVSNAVGGTDGGFER
jgi:hypothetical protein